jgi:hypothetical protein
MENALRQAQGIRLAASMSCKPKQVTLAYGLGWPAMSERSESNGGGGNRAVRGKSLLYKANSHLSH